MLRHIAQSDTRNDGARVTEQPRKAVGRRGGVLRSLIRRGDAVDSALAYGPAGST